MNSTTTTDAEITPRRCRAILRRRFGGLATTIAVLDEKAESLTEFAKLGPR